MAYRRLFLFVEGDDDARFFEHVVEPFFRKRYDSVQIVGYAEMKKTKLEGWVRSVRAMGADYLVIGDLDRQPCVTAAKKRVLQRCSAAEPERIQIVKTEIESWYCAGIPEGDPDWGDLPLARTPETEALTKEQCLRAMAASDAVLLPTWLALLERFDLHRAASRNGSFHYFLRKHLPETLGKPRR